MKRSNEKAMKSQSEEGEEIKWKNKEREKIEAY